MNKLTSPGVIAAACSFAAVLAATYSAAPLAVFFQDPKTPTLIVALIGMVGSLVAGLLPNHSKPEVVVPVSAVVAPETLAAAPVVDKAA